MLWIIPYSAEPIVEFRNGIIIDGTGTKPVKGSVWVRGDSIVAVGKKGPVASIVKDLKGLVIAPGFIDSHSHADGNIEKFPDAESQVFQGITTAIIGQDGFLSGTFEKVVTNIQQAHPSINFAAFTGHNSIRTKVMGQDQNRPPSKKELDSMKALVKEDMKAGALGLSTGLEYLPGFYSHVDEIIACAKVAKKFGGSYVSHIRSEDRQIMESIDELIKISKEAKLPARISHIKLGLPSVWGQNKEVKAKMDRARSAGLQVSCDIYPYPYWQSTITVITNRKDWEKVEVWRDAIAETGGPQNILLSDYSAKPEWKGKTILQISELEKQKPEDIVHGIVQSKLGAEVIVTSMKEKDIEAFMRLPYASICSDGGIKGSHPRGAGSFPRVLARYVREKKLLSLQEAIRKMTSLPASYHSFRDRGRIAPNFKADLVVFDPKKIQDRATPVNPTALSEGISMVMVNGALVIDGGKMTVNRPGRILRHTQ